MRLGEDICLLGEELLWLNRVWCNLILLMISDAFSISANRFEGAWTSATMAQYGTPIFGSYPVFMILFLPMALILIQSHYCGMKNPHSQFRGCNFYEGSDERAVMPTFHYE